MRKMLKIGMAALLCAFSMTLQGCAGGTAEVQPSPAAPSVEENAAAVAWPKEKLSLDAEGVPLLDVFVVEESALQELNLEKYIEGVLAGEMKNDWPLEALKAQAILARTFVLKFVSEKQSKYEGADISTDIEEAQAYDASAVNDRIRQAVRETSGLVLSAGGELPYAWFHAHSGGVTERAKAGLGWEKDEPAYTLSAAGNEPETLLEDVDSADAQTLKDAWTWNAEFSAEEFAEACRAQGVTVSVGTDTKLAIGERGESGRAVTLTVDGQPVAASELRIKLGSTKMRSTLLTSLKMENGLVLMSGKGYGHGVGMSQWGAYGMAENGAKAEEIVTHYFSDASVVSIE